MIAREKSIHANLRELSATAFTLMREINALMTIVENSEQANTAIDHHRSNQKTSLPILPILPPAIIAQLKKPASRRARPTNPSIYCDPPLPPSPPRNWDAWMRGEE